MSMTFGAWVLMAQAAMGGHHHAEKVSVANCDTCGAETRVILAEIDVLQHHPRWRKRDNAAHELRKFDWHTHPEVVAALSTALLTDGHGEVREEAAESLEKMAPCLPEAHAALDRAASMDPDRGTRRQARKALNKLGRRRCEGACQICAEGSPGGPIPLGPPVRVGEPVLTPEDQPPARLIIPPNLGPEGPSALGPMQEEVPPPTLRSKPIAPAEPQEELPPAIVDPPVAPPAESLPMEPPLESPR